MNSIVFRSGDWVADYSCNDNCHDEKTWTFTEEDPLVGMFGKLNRENKIKQLGWIMLDTECQAANEHWNENPTDPITPVNPVNPVTPTNPTDPVTPTNPTDPVNPVTPTNRE